MEVLENAPLIFLGSPEIEPLSARLRISLQCAHEQISSLQGKTQTTGNLVGDPRKIRHGIAVLGPEIENGVPVIPISAITNEHSIDYSKLRYVSTEIADNHPHTKLHGGEVIISVKGTLGKTAIVPTDLSGGNITREVAVFPVENKVDAEFLLLVLNSDLGLSQMTVRSFGEMVAESIVGSAITLPELRNLVIPKINSDEKRKILQNYDHIFKLSQGIREKVGAVEVERIATLDSILESIASALKIPKFPRPWFGRLYFQKAESGIDRIDVLGANPQFEDECWKSGKFVPLSDACEVDGSNEQIPLGTQRYISIDSLPGNYWGDIELPEMEIEKQTGRTHFYPGDIAWAHLKPSILQGKAYIIHGECWGSHHFLKLNTSKVSEDLRTIIWAYLKTGPIKRHLANKCTGKSESQKDVSDNALGMIPFPKLNDGQIKRVASAIRDTIERSHELESQENAYKEKADDLLKKAKSNIFNLVDDDWFNVLVSEAKEALQ